MGKTLEYKRAVRRNTGIADTWKWVTRCGRFCVQRSKYLLEDRRDGYFAMRLNQYGGWSIISQHRKRDTAEHSCQTYANDTSVSGVVLVRKSKTVARYEYGFKADRTLKTAKRLAQQFISDRPDGEELSMEVVENA